MRWIWHGFNRDPVKRAKQCYYEWNCVVCYLRHLGEVARLRLKYSKGEESIPVSYPHAECAGCPADSCWDCPEDHKPKEERDAG